MAQFGMDEDFIIGSRQQSLLVAVQQTQFQKLDHVGVDVFLVAVEGLRELPDIQPYVSKDHIPDQHAPQRYHHDDRGIEGHGKPQGSGRRALFVAEEKQDAPDGKG